MLVNGNEFSISKILEKINYELEVFRNRSERKLHLFNLIVKFDNF